MGCGWKVFCNEGNLLDNLDGDGLDSVWRWVLLFPCSNHALDDAKVYFATGIEPWVRGPHGEEERLRNSP